LPHRILIVDDEQIVLDAFQRGLEMREYVVATATSGTRALELCEQTTYDLVILDFIMPNMDGIQLLVRIRKIQPHIRSIIISGQIKAEVDEKQLGKDLGQWVEADLYLHKPVSIEKLAESVATVLQETNEEKDWQSIAKEAVKGHKTKLSVAKTAAKKLSVHRKPKK
jgi:CheY-like chemotaxis protein